MQSRAGNWSDLGWALQESWILASPYLDWLPSLHLFSGNKRVILSLCSALFIIRGIKRPTQCNFLWYLGTDFFSRMCANHKAAAGAILQKFFKNVVDSPSVCPQNFGLSRDLWVSSFAGAMLIFSVPILSFQSCSKLYDIILAYQSLLLDI